MEAVAPSNSPGVSSALDVRPKVTGSQPLKRFIRQQVPQEILDDPELKAAMRALPQNYNFEIHKTIWRLKKINAKCVALQFPEGLLMYACSIADILERFAGLEECIVLGDVTYGACCVDDFSAQALGADFLVHYGHSCLVPVDVTSIPCLYVFVDIQVNVLHLVETIRLNFETEKKLVLAGTVQFLSSIQAARAALSDTHSHLTIPQAKPLSGGEVLGCTAPTVDSAKADAIVFVADGRFHLEAIMIANPSIPAYRYDPYAQVLTKEEYDQVGMRAARRRMIDQAQDAERWGVILGTLGRQGNPRILAHVISRLQERGLHWTVFLLSEITPAKLAHLQSSMDAWVQIACPRLSIDWGEGFSQPLLTPYEAEVALNFLSPWWKPQSDSPNQPVSGPTDYPMDYYAKDGGHWNSVYTPPANIRAPPRSQRTAMSAKATSAEAISASAMSAGPTSTSSTSADATRDNSTSMDAISH